MITMSYYIMGEVCVLNKTIEDFRRHLPTEEELDRNTAFDYPEWVYRLAAFLLPAARLIPRALGVYRAYEERMLPDPSGAADYDYCLILGALLYEDGSITPVMVRRLTRAYEAYEANPRMRFVIAGVGPEAERGSDVDVMADYFEVMGVPRRQIFRDYRGANSYRAFRSMRRRCHGRPFLVVSSDFHMPRCMYIAKRLGIRAAGLGSAETFSKYETFYTFRECFADIKARAETGRYLRRK